MKRLPRIVSAELKREPVKFYTKSLVYLVVSETCAENYVVGVVNDLPGIRNRSMPIYWASG